MVFSLIKLINYGFQQYKIIIKIHMLFSRDKVKVGKNMNHVMLNSIEKIIILLVNKIVFIENQII